jgi:predicted Ser/Thr protein kinase
MIGRRIEQFEVRSLLGRGGMGEVYLADDAELHRKVALKVVSVDDPQLDRGKQLQREARTTAALDHPFICKVFQTGDFEGLWYFAMEYVEGETLRARLGAGPLSIHDTVRIAREIAEAMEFAHSRGVIHRDLKPGNVMLARDGHVRVMDFGISKRVRPESGDWTTPSPEPEAGALSGTLAYMSPEQVRGLPLDTRTDVFSFGILLYELLTGRHPFRRERAFATAVAILYDEVAWPNRHKKRAPTALIRMVGRCLEKAPDRRWASFTEVRQALNEVDGPSLPAPRRISRRTALVTAAALSVVTTAAVALLWLDRRATRLRDSPVVVRGRSGTNIFVGDRHVGEIGPDGTLSFVLPSGNYELRFDLAGFLPSTVFVHASNGVPLEVTAAAAQMPIPAMPPPGVIRFRGLTPGARVLIDRAEAGTVADDGSLEANVPPGKHKVQILAAGFEPYGVTVAVSLGQLVVLDQIKLTRVK